jgi:membrane protein EpsK
LRTLGLTIAVVLSPPIVVRHAQGDAEGLLRVLRQASKFLGLIVALPAGLMCGFAGPLLGTWLGPSFQDLAPLTWWLVLPLCVEASQLHLSAVWIAADKLRVISLQTVACGVAYIVLAVLLVREFHWGLYGISVASAIASLLRNGVLSPIYTASLTHLPRWTLSSYAWKTLLSSFVFAALTAMAFARLPAGSWFKLALAAAPVSLAYCGVTYFALLNSEERTTLRRIIFARRAEP